VFVIASKIEKQGVAS